MTIEQTRQITLYLNGSKFKLKHAVGSGFDENSWKQLRTGFHLKNGQSKLITLVKQGHISFNKL